MIYVWKQIWYWHLHNLFYLLQILQILVRAVVENLTDSRGEQAVSQQSKLRELLGRVSSRHSSDPEIWRLYALVYGDGQSSNPEDNEKVSTTSRPLTPRTPYLLSSMVVVAILRGYFAASGSGTLKKINWLYIISSSWVQLGVPTGQWSQIHIKMVKE